MSVEIQVALGGRQDEGHGDDVHLFAGTDEPADCEEEVVELAIACRRTTFRLLAPSTLRRREI